MQSIFKVPQTEPKEVCRGFNPNTPMGNPRGSRYFDLLEAASQLDNATCRKILDSVKEGVFLPEPFFGMTAEMIADYLEVDSKVVYAMPHRSDGFYVAENIEPVIAHNLEAYATTARWVPYTKWRECTFPNGAKVLFKGWRCTLYSPRAILLLSILCMNHSTIATRVSIAAADAIKKIQAEPKVSYKSANEIIRYVSQIEGIAPGTQIQITTPDGEKVSGLPVVSRREEHQKILDKTEWFEVGSVLDRPDHDLKAEPVRQARSLTKEQGAEIDKFIIEHSKVFKGFMGDKEIAVRFGISPLCVRRRIDRLVEQRLFEKPVAEAKTASKYCHRLSSEQKNELRGFLLVNAKAFG